MVNYTITIPDKIFQQLRFHLFQNSLEQGAFLFSNARRAAKTLDLEVLDIYLVPKTGWEVQKDVYLEMKDAERARIMAIAKRAGFLAIDCHSHPNAGDKAWFSFSDIKAIKEFAGYAKWKLDGRPFAAMVWGESSVDAVMWHDSFDKANQVDEVIVLSNPNRAFIPTGTWPKHNLSSQEIFRD